MDLSPPVAILLRQIPTYTRVRKTATTSVVGKMAQSIRFSTVSIIELSTNIHFLKGMDLKPPFETLVPTLVTVYEQKIALEKELKTIAAAFISGSPLPGIDYPKLAARAPEITAEMDELDKTLFQTAPLVFGLLVDPRPDREGHSSHLITTKSERRDLIHRLNVAFGSRLEQRNPNYVVGAAVTLRYGLLKNFKNVDDPW
jgi:hypothetical protein